MCSCFLVVYLLIIGVTSQEKEATIRRLRKDLLKDYDKNARPVYHHGNTTTVEFRLNPLQITKLDEEKSSFSSDCWIVMMWNDEHLKWKPEDYSGIGIVSFADHEIWQPDILVYNAAESEIDPRQKVFTLVHSDGNVMWVPPAKIKVICTVNYDGYPQDIQKCLVKFGSWVTSGLAIDLKYVEPDMADFWDNNPYWKLLKVEGLKNEKYYPCCPEPYVSVDYTFTIQRRGSVFELPCRLLRTTAHVLMLCMFWFPADSYDKFKPGLFGIVSHIVALCITSRAVNTPAAVQVAFSSLTPEFAAALTAIIVEVIIFNIANIRGLRFPGFLKFSSTDFFKNIFCLFIKPPSVSKYDRVEAETENMDGVRLHIASERSDAKKGWFAFATILDRISFIIFVIVFISVGSYI